MTRFKVTEAASDGAFRKVHGAALTEGLESEPLAHHIILTTCHPAFAALEQGGEFELACDLVESAEPTAEPGSIPTVGTEDEEES